MNKKHFFTYIGLFSTLFLLLMGIHAEVVQADESVWVSAENLPNNLILQTTNKNDYLLHNNARRLFVTAHNGADNYVLRYTTQGNLEGGFYLGAAYTYQFGLDKQRNWLLVDRSDGLLDIYNWQGDLVRQVALPSGFGALKPARPQADGNDAIYLFRDASIITFNVRTFELQFNHEYDLRCENGQPTQFVEAHLDINPDILYLVYPWKACNSANVQYKLMIRDKNRPFHLVQEVALGTTYNFIAQTAYETYLQHNAWQGDIDYVTLVDGIVTDTFTFASEQQPITVGFGFSTRWGEFLEAVDGYNEMIITTNGWSDQHEQRRVVVEQLPPFNRYTMQVVVGSSADNLIVIQPSGLTVVAIETFRLNEIAPPPIDECIIPPSGPWPPCATGDGNPAPSPDKCVIPSSGPWPPCATGGSDDPVPPTTDECIIPSSGPWPACARSHLFLQ